MSHPSLWNQLILVVFSIFVSSALYFIFAAWKARAPFARLRKKAYPMPDWNPVLGNLSAMGQVKMGLPADAHQNYVLAELAKKYIEADVPFYLDTWPFMVPLLVVTSPAMAIQACQEFDLPKPLVLERFFRHFAGGDHNLFTMNGPEWKSLRAMFNPGFSSKYVLGMLDQVVREAADLVEILRERAQKGDIFPLDDVMLNFTMDVIGAVSMNSRFRSQRQFNQLASSMKDQVRWHPQEPELNLFKLLNPVRPFVRWNNSRKMNDYISTELDKRFAERQTSTDNSSRSVIDLVLDDYMKQNPSANMASKIDPDFKKWATVQLRLFLFAGHDSTASTITYCYHMLSKHPEAMKRIRAEHDEIFGTDLSTVAAQLHAEPQKINQLPYTTAVLKEVMRLLPIASAVRSGQPGVYLTDPQGNQYPTEGTIILILHNALQRNPKYWKAADDFIPERWLVGPEDPLYPVKGAWRPFEFGPRNCIGQTLVMLDVKTTLVMTLREFDIKAAYDDWDVLHPREGLKTVWGERAYQIFAGSAHPSDGFPCRVHLRKQN